MKFLSHKECLCHLCNGYHIFTIYKCDDTYYSYECNEEFDMSHSFVKWDSYEEILKGICWLKDIVDAITDEQLRKDVELLGDSRC